MSEAVTREFLPGGRNDRLDQGRGEPRRLVSHCATLQQCIRIDQGWCVPGPNLRQERECLLPRVREQQTDRPPRGCHPTLCEPVEHPWNRLPRAHRDVPPRPLHVRDVEHAPRQFEIERHDECTPRRHARIPLSTRSLHRVTHPERLHCAQTSSMKSSVLMSTRTTIRKRLRLRALA